MVTATKARAGVVKGYERRELLEAALVGTDLCSLSTLLTLAVEAI